MTNAQIIAVNILIQIAKDTQVRCRFREIRWGKTYDDLPYLQVRVGVEKNNLYIRVIYMPDNTYNVELIKNHPESKEALQLEEYEDVYAEQLSSIIYSIVHAD